MPELAEQRRVLLAQLRGFAPELLGLRELAALVLPEAGIVLDQPSSQVFLERCHALLQRFRPRALERSTTAPLDPRWRGMAQLLHRLGWGPRRYRPDRRSPGDLQ
jgi:hypothetical protein